MSFFQDALEEQGQVCISNLSDGEEVHQVGPQLLNKIDFVFQC